MVKTTAQMDGWDGDPADPRRWQTWYMCRECGLWTKFQGTEENSGHYRSGAKCEHCGSTRLDPQSATSDRSFDQARAKARTATVLRMKKRKH